MTTRSTTLANTFRRLCLTVTVAASVSAASAQATALPTEIQATYNIYKSGMLIARDEETFRRDGDSYKIVSESRPQGALKLFFKEHIVITSEGKVNAQGLKPLAYEYRRADPSRSVRARFDWVKNEITSEHGSKREVFALPALTQDRLSSMYQFMVNIPRANEIIAWMSTGKKSERYSYVKRGEPTINTKAGEFATVHYARVADAGDAKAELWLAKDRYYLPVRVAFTDKNGSFEQVLTGLRTR
jgi:Protein of unknown function (DUF3108)